MMIDLGHLKWWYSSNAQRVRLLDGGEASITQFLSLSLECEQGLFVLGHTTMLWVLPCASFWNLPTVFPATEMRNQITTQHLVLHFVLYYTLSELNSDRPGNQNVSFGCPFLRNYPFQCLIQVQDYSKVALAQRHDGHTPLQSLWSASSARFMCGFVAATLNWIMMLKMKKKTQTFPAEMCLRPSSPQIHYSSNPSSLQCLYWRTRLSTQWHVTFSICLQDSFFNHTFWQSINSPGRVAMGTPSLEMAAEPFLAPVWLYPQH